MNSENETPDPLQRIIARTRTAVSLLPRADDADEDATPTPRPPWERSIPDGFAWCRLGSNLVHARATIDHDAFLSTTLARLMSAPVALFWGPSGGGKTVLATACFRRWCEEHSRIAHTAMWVSTLDLIGSRLRHGLGHGEPPLLARAMRASLLLLDEFRDDVKPRPREIVDLIFKRHDHNRPTWITTGTAPSDLRQRLADDDGLQRRMLQRTVFVKLEAPK